MAEFVQTMKDWRRMCKAYTREDDDCCMGCPVVNFREHGCGAIFECEDDMDWQRYADAIMSWAAKNPEPVYPTWLEWMTEQGLCKSEFGYDEHVPIEHQIKMTTLYTQNHVLFNGGRVYLVTDGAMRPIPADIAQKLGLEQKEG